MLLVLFAFFLLALAEGALRLLHVAAPEPLIVRVTNGPFDVYQLNSKIGRNYFPPAMERIMPSPGFRIFPVRKQPGTTRIFVLGESSAAGFPYHTNGAFSGFLEDRLSVLLPGRHFEVINCALTAINSYAVLDFVKELRKYEPDLFILYLGHNEYYGALGPASTAAAGRAAPLVRPLLSLRLARVMRSAWEKAQGTGERIQGKTVMEAMTGQTGIRPGDRIDRAAVSGFEKNLRAVLSEAGNVPVVLCDQASNLRDLPPFQSTHAPGLSAERHEAFERRLDEAERAIDAGNLSAGSAAIDAVVQEDSTDAAARFLRGRCFEAEGAPREAFREYRAARDADGIPFRAPDRINAVIRRVAADGRALYVPVEAAFRARARDGIPGADLFYEHVHPRLAGQQLIADAILRGLSARGWIAPSGEWRWDADRTPEEYLRLACITPLDDELADQRIFRLTHKWPFPESSAARYVSTRDPAVVSLAEAVLEHRTDLAAAHARLGKSLLDRGDPAGALQEYQAVCRIFPVVPENFATAARLLSRLGRREEALSYLGEALRMDPGNPQYRALQGELGGR